MSGVLVLNPTKDQSQIPYQQYPDEVTNLSTSVVKKTFGLGMSVVSLAYMQGGGNAATSKCMYFVVNALSDNDAAVRLATPGARYPIPFGDIQKIVAPATAKITRIDLVADAAETGTSKVIITKGA